MDRTVRELDIRSVLVDSRTDEFYSVHFYRNKTIVFNVLDHGLERTGQTSEFSKRDINHYFHVLSLRNIDIIVNRRCEELGDGWTCKINDNSINSIKYAKKKGPRVIDSGATIQVGQFATNGLQISRQTVSLTGSISSSDD